MERVQMKYISSEELYETLMYLEDNADHNDNLIFGIDYGDVVYYNDEENCIFVLSGDSYQKFQLTEDNFEFLLDSLNDQIEILNMEQEEEKEAYTFTGLSMTYLYYSLDLKDLSIKNEFLEGALSFSFRLGDRSFETARNPIEPGKISEPAVKIYIFEVLQKFLNDCGIDFACGGEESDSYHALSGDFKLGEISSGKFPLVGVVQ